MNARATAITISIIILLFIIDLIRREKMTFKYSVLWIAASSIATLLAIHERLLESMTHFFGFLLPSNFIFFLLLSFFILINLLLTVYINQQNNRLEALAQAIAIIQYQTKQKTLKTSDEAPINDTNKPT